MSKPEPLIVGEYYHIYNRGNNRENLFVEERNFRYFLQLYANYIQPIAYTYAYCLLRNHFHLVVRIKELENLPQDWQSLSAFEAASRYVSRQFAVLFSTYTKSFNKGYGRTGSLFAKPFRRIRVDSDAYFQHLIIYIHQNPERHGFVDDFRAWPYSSYGTIISRKRTHLQRATVLDWFRGQEAFVDAHGQFADELLIEPLLFDEF